MPPEPAMAPTVTAPTKLFSKRMKIHDSISLSLSGNTPRAICCHHVAPVALRASRDPWSTSSNASENAFVRKETVWNIMPITAASEPSPMATVNTRTQIIVGTERMIAITVLMMLLTNLFDRLLAARSDSTSAMSAPPAVASTAMQRVTASPSNMSAQV